MERYDPATNTWATVVNYGSSDQELAYGAAVVYDGRLYRCGGERHSATSIPGPVPMWVHSYTTTSTCSTYEPGVGIDYDSFNHMQEARRRHGLVELGGRLYAVGGYAASAESALLPERRPAPFAKSSPANGAAGVALSPTLSWQAMTGALWYGYCYDTTDNDACDPISWQDAGTATSAGLTGLAPNTTYYWQVFASTSSLPVYGDGEEWWSFTTGAPVSHEMTFHSTGTYDGWVLESGEASGVGGSRNATATTARLGDDASDRQYRSLLHFNTAALPNNAVITGVTLRIRRQSIVGTSPLGTHGSLTVDVRTGSFGIGGTGERGLPSGG